MVKALNQNSRREGDSNASPFLLNQMITVTREEFIEKIGFFTEFLLNAGSLNVAPDVRRYILEFDILD